MSKKYFLGLDVGTDSVGYAVTDESYRLLKFHGKEAWGSTIFDEAYSCADRRSFRSGRRRLERRKQRVQLLQEIFAGPIANKDPRFYTRLSESYLWREDTQDRYVFFNDEDYTDAQYMSQYPTIHHLIMDLMKDSREHDVRLVYLACAWLVAHRGHFLSNLNVDHLEEIVDIQKVYNSFLAYFDDNGFVRPWESVNIQEFGKILQENIGVNAKYKKLVAILLKDQKPEKGAKEEFPFSQEGIIKLLAGGQYKLKDLYGNPEYEDLGSCSLGMEEEKFAELMANIGDDYDLLAELRALYDWSLLAEILGGTHGATISEAKVAIFDQHKRDLKTLKYFIKKYCPNQYNEMFRDAAPDNYVAYSYHVDETVAKELKKKADVESFSKKVLKVISKMQPSEADMELYNEMCSKLETRSFLPKQKNTDNRVIPHQLYEYELMTILKNASNYLPFLKEVDDEGISNQQKILSIFRFRIPYFVGPLNGNSSNAWIERKAGVILPWNFETMVDFDKSEQAFIQRMTNKCTYLPSESVLPKDSLYYQRFMVLNEINNLKIDGRKISVEVKQKIYCDLFQKKKKVRRKDIEDYLVCNGILAKGQEQSVSGIDEQIKSSLSSFHAFKRLLDKQELNEQDVENIIERASYAEDKHRVAKWLKVHYSHLSSEDIKYICRIKIKDFGRLSLKFLNELVGADKQTGEIRTILQTMWEKNENLMELLSERYTFLDAIKAEKENYYKGEKATLENRLNDMYVSNAVKRSIYRTLDIVKDVTKAFGKPEKIFIEMTRGERKDLKGKRTRSRRQQILDFYEKCKDEDVKDLRKQLEDMGEYVDNQLQGERLFLYFMQFGKCAYSGQDIQLEKLMAGSKEYDIDHIYPQAYVKDDSIIQNKVLVLSTYNGAKKDVYPIAADIRANMRGIWDNWRHIGTLSEEKYKRLIRSTPFTEEEKYGFINRQLTETSQSTKAIAELLKTRFPETEIVYTKAGLTSEFRHEFECYKSRSYNDLHHAVDAYLNIVTGNVYHMRFSKQWFRVDTGYSIKTKTLFTHSVICNGRTIWDGEKMLRQVINTARRNTAHFTKYAFFKTGGLFDQMPVKASAGLISLKKGRSTEKYGGYNKAGVMFFIPTRYKCGKKQEVIIMPVELLQGKHFLEDEAFAKEYAVDRLQRILGKKVEEISFPLGMRPWKVNTMLSLDGFRICITGTGSGGKCLLALPVMQFSTEEHWKYYIGKLEKLAEKIKENPQYRFDPNHEVISREDNERLYKVYLDKLQNSIYRKRINAPTETLIAGFEKFQKLSIFEQCRILLNIQQVFGRMAGGCDLEAIGGKKHSAATMNFSTTISNWKKNYSDVRIIDLSASGLWERVSDNLLELV